uniref:WAT1-related protein n=1 Tax=Brassica campestris TaxID=3711 RepID=M4EYR2_BRACM
MATKICEMWREMKAITAMVVVQIATAVLNILFKLAVVDGMEPRVLVAYRLFFATLFMIPLSLIFQREKRPEFTWNLLLLALLSGLLGAVLPSIFTITGLALTSATFASAAAVLTPLITFVKVGKQFGGAYWNATLMNLTGSVVAVIIVLCWNCDLKEWKLGWNIRLFTIAYASIVMSGMVIAVNAWCVESRGPLFVSVFSPVALVVVALVGSFILNETLHVGSIIGTVIIVGGLYLVLWGKNKEMKSITPTSDYIETNKTTSKDISLKNLPTLSTNVP